jgi:hypothetical protein
MISSSLIAQLQQSKKVQHIFLRNCLFLWLILIANKTLAAINGQNMNNELTNIYIESERMK